MNSATRRRFLIAGAVVGALAVATLLFLFDPADSAGTIGRDGSALVDPAPRAALGIEREPISYRIVYRAEAPGDDGLLTTTDDLVVRRPFDSVLRSYTGDRVAGEPRSITAASFGRLLLAGPNRDDLVLAESPAVSPSDVRFGPVVDDALSRDLVELRERREVLGRACQVYRSGEPLGTGAIEPPTVEKHTDTCVDAAGLVLEELLTVQGEILFRRIAIEVEEGVELPEDPVSSEAEPMDLNRGGGSVLRMSEGSRTPGEFWQLPRPPRGFRDCGRFNVIPPQPENAADPLREGLLRSATVDVWTDGPDVLLLEQGGTLGGTHPFELSGPSIELGGLGTGDFVLGTHGTRVRALIGGGRYVQVQGTLPLEDLVSLARSLEPGEGGTIEVVDGPPELTC